MVAALASAPKPVLIHCKNGADRSGLVGALYLYTQEGRSAEAAGRELTVFCAALIGAGLGFLWFNCHPAQVFMGDTGSLALGGAFGIIAVLIHQPFVLVIAGGIFVLEAVSVLLQTGWFRFTRMQTGTGRRIFLMAPLHHHFEKKGWYESQVVIRFYILCVLFAVVALATLKLR